MRGSSIRPKLVNYSPPNQLDESTSCKVRATEPATCSSSDTPVIRSARLRDGVWCQGRERDTDTTKSQLESGPDTGHHSCKQACRDSLWNDDERWQRLCEGCDYNHTASILRTIGQSASDRASNDTHCGEEWDDSICLPECVGVSAASWVGIQEGREYDRKQVGPLFATGDHAEAAGPFEKDDYEPEFTGK